MCLAQTESEEGQTQNISVISHWLRERINLPPCLPMFLYAEDGP